MDHDAAHRGHCEMNRLNCWRNNEEDSNEAKSSVRCRISPLFIAVGGLFRSHRAGAGLLGLLVPAIIIGWFALRALRRYSLAG
jgi:hypothetical protein